MLKYFRPVPRSELLLQNGLLAPALLPVIELGPEESVGMPVTYQKSDASDMNSDTSPSCRPRAFSRGGSLESRSSSSRSRSFTLDDESLKYLTHEEKDVLLFFEETIDSLDEDFEEPVLCDGGACCPCSPSLGESTSSLSEPEDVIDLVQLAPRARESEGLPERAQTAGPAPSGKEHRKQDAETPAPPADTPTTETLPPAPETVPAPPVPGTPEPPRRELRAPSPPKEHPRLLRSVPTPLVIAQKISERLAESEAFSPTFPSREGRQGEWRTPAAWGRRSGDPDPRPSRPAQPKAPRFPSNIIVTNGAAREPRRTLSKAAVSVQERKAQVLATIHGHAGAFPATGDAGEGAPGRGCFPEPVARGQDRTGPAESLRAGSQAPRGPALANGFPSAHEALKSAPSTFAPTGKSLCFHPGVALPSTRGHQSVPRPRQPDGGKDAQRRADSLPRPQGVTVQFVGRGSSEEARREALRKLGLLRETS
ncbi:proline and serine-rich protein 2 isoform X1 [Cebus imitator]|uniref:proline and serine-rich protein 2 isoform X1 n=2 Tax=Cebus imitator TaxID=2715852 RepID=UPI00080A75BD|nr:proline and serine-rich protein 2 isoform X1 [Cebus imitator]